MRDLTEKPSISRAKDTDHLVCPNSATGQSYPAERAWDTVTPSGERKRLGVFKKHRHFYDKISNRDCDQSGLIGEVIYKPKPNPERG